MTLDSEFSKDKPLLTTGIVASMLGITPDRLRTYDTEKLIITHRLQTGEVKKRLYSRYDVEWLQSVRVLVKTYKMSISSIKFLLQTVLLNKEIKFPNNEIGKIILEMKENPNFKLIVKNF